MVSKETKMGSLRTLKQKTTEEVTAKAFENILNGHDFWLYGEEWGNPKFVTLTFKSQDKSEGTTVMIDFIRDGFIAVYYPSHIDWASGIHIKMELSEENFIQAFPELLERGRKCSNF